MGTFADFLKLEFDRITVPAREAIIKKGGKVDGPVEGLSQVFLKEPPEGIVVVRIMGEPDVAVRLEHEPPYPNEIPGDWSDHGDWVPCPRCRAALCWDEAGRVPGARMCLNGHQVQLSNDGRSAR